MVLVCLATMSGLTACQSTADFYAETARSVSADSANDPAARVYNQQVAATIAREGLKRDRLLDADRPGGWISERLAADRAELEAHAKAAPHLDKRSVLVTTGQFDATWRLSRHMFYLKTGPDLKAPARFAFSGLQALRTDIELAVVGGRPVRMALTCDGPVSLKMRSAGLRRIAAKERFSINDPGNGKTRTFATIRLSSGTSQCLGSMTIGGYARTVELFRQEKTDPNLRAEDSRFDLCALPDYRQLPALEQAFYKPSRLSTSCHFQPGPVDLINNEIDGFNAKVKVLLGRPLTRAFIDAHDPEAPIDFSAAPKARLIYVSYLDIKADFSGRVIDRLLRHHAQNGTIIRIQASAILEREKDRALFENLAGDFPNVELRLYDWNAPKRSTFVDKVSEFHKVHHVKLLALLSSEPGRSTAIIGGRNIHDGFLFNQPIDLTRYPFLNQYTRNRGLTIDYYSNWHDFDIALHDDQVVRTLAAHFATLWFDDADTHLARPFSVTVGGAKLPVRPVARHFVSIPYIDGGALEDYYSELIDAAHERIDIVNPYLHFTPKMAVAIDKAVKRGVKITVIGRIDLRGDLGGDILTALNQVFVNAYADEIEIYDFKPKRTVLHSKILMIDRKLAIVSSVNLNHRSFIHDSENGIAFLDPAFCRRIATVFEGYRAESKKVGKERVNLFWRLLLANKIVNEAL